MTMLDGRIGRFVGAARKLLIVQAAVALLAAALSAWAYFEVRGLAAERDRLQSRVSQLEGQRMAPAALPVQAPVESPEGNLMTAPAASIIIPVPIPVPVTGPDPEIDSAIAGEAPPAPAGVTPAPEVDCSGANASLPRCRPGRWRRRDAPVQSPAAPPAGETERAGNQQQPRLD